MKATKPHKGFNRRVFFAGLIGGVGVATTALASGVSRKRASQKAEDVPEGPVLYRRTADVERYFNTLDY